MSQGFYNQLSVKIPRLTRLEITTSPPADGRFLQALEEIAFIRVPKSCNYSWSLLSSNQNLERIDLKDDLKRVSPNNVYLFKALNDRFYLSNRAGSQPPFSLCSNLAEALNDLDVLLREVSGFEPSENEPSEDEPDESEPDEDEPDENEPDEKASKPDVAARRKTGLRTRAKSS